MRILLIEADPARSAELKDAMRDLPAIEVVDVEKAMYTLPPPGLDMVFMSFPAAERWGPDFKSRSTSLTNGVSTNQLVGLLHELLGSGRGQDE